MTCIAYAAEAGAQWAQGALPIMMIIVGAIFYFIVFRPQIKKQKEQQTMINNLKKGDRIVTSGGLHGLVIKVEEVILTMEIADKVHVKINRGHVAALVTKPQKKQSDKSDSKKIKSK